MTCVGIQSETLQWWDQELYYIKVHHSFYSYMVSGPQYRADGHQWFILPYMKRINSLLFLKGEEEAVLYRNIDTTLTAWIQFWGKKVHISQISNSLIMGYLLTNMVTTQNWWLHNCRSICSYPSLRCCFTSSQKQQIFLDLKTKPDGTVNHITNRQLQPWVCWMKTVKHINAWHRV